MQKNWKIIEADKTLVLSLSKEMKVSPVLSRILLNRGINSKSQAQAFLNPEMKYLHSPLDLPDIQKALTRIKKAVANNEKILVFGDYDVDGVAACALMKSTLIKLGAKHVFHHLPHRLNEGYGLNKNAVRLAKEKHIDLLITVDCGITNFEEVKLLNKFKIDTIIVDHHEAQKDILPSALAVIDPKRPDNRYPFRDLAAVGLVYKLCQALTQKTLDEDLDLVVLGTVADVVPLTGENRILVKNGLEYLSNTKKPGLQALIQVCGLGNKHIQPSYISFILGPRLNASGRISSAEVSLELLMCQDYFQAMSLAERLNKENRKRQDIEEEILKEALGLVEREINFKDHHIIVLSKEGWHKGVLGIIASKIVERYYRPCVIISLDEKQGKGSGRSTHNFHLFEALAQCSHTLENFGGHKHAAGLVLTRENLDGFKSTINAIARQRLKPEDLIPRLDIDADIPLGLINTQVLEELEALFPFGIGNPKPIISSCGLKLKGKPFVVGRDNLKFWVTDGKTTFCSIGFGMAGHLDLVAGASALDLAYSLGWDNWQGEENIQLEIKDIRPH